MVRYTKQDFIHQLETGIDRIENVKNVTDLLAIKGVTVTVKRRKVKGKDKFYFTFDGLDLNLSPMTEAIMNWSMTKFFPDAKCYRVKTTQRFWKEY